MRLMFCNIGWMARYEGIKGQSDRIVGGGSYVDENNAGGEVCNFVRCADGHVYGHVETLKGKRDRKIELGKLGAPPAAEFVDGIDVIWTATHPAERSRRVVGWYRNAQVFRRRQKFPKYPSAQHRKDSADSFRIRARHEDAVLLPPEARELRLESRVKGWMGHAQWWFPDPDRHPKVAEFLEKMRALLMAGNPSLSEQDPLRGLGKVSSPERGLVERLIRDRQPAFRKAVMNAYGGRCCVTGCTVEASLEAAHIDRYSHSGDDRVTNGLLLRADLHRLFDAELLTLCWSGDMLRIQLHSSITDASYVALQGQAVRLPAKLAHQPNQAHFGPVNAHCSAAITVAS